MAAAMTAGSLPLPVLAGFRRCLAIAAATTAAPVPVAGDPYVFSFKQLGRNAR
jgi:hypothetical protein